MSKFTAEYRVDNRTFSLDIEAEGWQEAEFKLEALRDNGYFVEKDVIEYQLDSFVYRARCRHFETEEEARRHLAIIKFHSRITGEVVFRTKVPNLLAGLIPK